MGFFQVTLFLSAFLCSLVAGFLFAFAVVAMPGIKSLGDREFIRAFQVMDRVIQNNQPVFMLVWLGSIIVLIISTVLGMGQLAGINRLLMILAALTYLLGVQLTTITVNIPLNNYIQSVDVNTMDDTALKNAREAFEPRWNRWNTFRALLSSLVSVLLIVLACRL